ncbi:ABC transporter substrate-binding protein [Streptomyces sp. NBC_00487]|uniref:ABC transporter substrate-binding protein n=1 Tax=unclassified Streptomyces TaxID=2593676 RepID=UPI002E17A7A3|nr:MULTISPECIES: ABC transporter substrate-binding protein [unclassified Streptomyces]
MGKKSLSGVLITAAMLAVAGCSGGAATTGEAANAPADPGKVSGEIKVLTHRTDLVQNGTMDTYAAEFNKVYPKVKVTFEAITDYEGEVKIRMNTDQYGDVLMIPNAIAKDDYPKFFASLGGEKQLAGKYRFIDKSAVGGKVYGVATVGNANGFVYNKAVWKKAGITDWPTTPARFLDDLEAIKARTGAVPYYTNFKDAWPLTSPWTGILGSVSCDPQASNKLVSADPWAKGSDLTVADTLLYDIVHGKLAEKDPSTTNWEASKGMIAKGDIATMLLGSWAITQMQDAAEKAGTNPDDIGFMPFPAQVDGKFCSVVSADYVQAVSIHSEHKEAARAWLDWFTDKSGFAQNEGSVPTLKSSALPATLKPYTDAGVRLIEVSQSETGTVNAIDKAAEIGLNTPDYRQKLVDMARGAQKGDLDDYLTDLGERWNEAAKTAGS